MPETGEGEIFPFPRFFKNQPDKTKNRNMQLYNLQTTNHRSSPEQPAYSAFFERMGWGQVSSSPQPLEQK